MKKIEELLEHEDELSYLDENDMEEIYKLLRHCNPNITTDVDEDDSLFCNNPSINIHGYVLQQSDLGHCRLLKDGVRLAHGCEELFVSSIYNKILERKFLASHTEREYGLVFSGGGAKGAYEIGVWKALIELGLADRITGISGTSVGALNALLFGQGDYEIAEKTWDKFEQKDLTKIRHLIKIEDSAITFDGNGNDRKKPDEIITSIVESIRKISFGLFDTSLPRVVDECMHSYDFLNDKIVYVCMSLRGWMTFKNKDKELDPEWHRAYYFPLNVLDRSEVKDVAIASSKIPLVYPKSSIRNKSLVDGSVKDVVPARPLIDAGFKKIIVVRLDYHKMRKSSMRPKCGSLLFNIYPSSSLGSIILIDKKKTRDRREMGYRDAMKFLKPLVEQGILG